MGDKDEWWGEIVEQLEESGREAMQEVALAEQKLDAALRLHADRKSVESASKATQTGEDVAMKDANAEQETRGDVKGDSAQQQSEDPAPRTQTCTLPYTDTRQSAPPPEAEQKHEENSK